MNIRQMTMFNVSVVYVTDSGLGKGEVRVRSFWRDPKSAEQKKKKKKKKKKQKGKKTTQKLI